MKKKQISLKSLEEELARVKAESEIVRKERYHLDNENYRLQKEINSSLSEIKAAKENGARKVQEASDSTIGLLTEIIRWQCNPETAKTPFKGSSNSMKDFDILRNI